MDIDITVNNKLEIVIMQPAGLLDVTQSAKLEQIIDAMIENHPDYDILINLKRATSINSSCLRVLVTSSRKMKEHNNRIAICEPNDVIRKTIEIINLDRVVDVYNNEAAFLVLKATQEC